MNLYSVFLKPQITPGFCIYMVEVGKPFEFSITSMQSVRIDGDNSLAFAITRRGKETSLAGRSSLGNISSQLRFCVSISVLKSGLIVELQG